MAQGKTIWEMLKGKVAPSAPSTASYYNPLDYQVGNPVLIDDEPCKGFSLAVTAIREYTRTLSGRIFKFTDYILNGRNIEGSCLTLRLRAMPSNNGGVEVMVLYLSDEMAFDEGFLGVLNDDTGEFNITDDKTQQTDNFSRINDIKGSYKADVTELASEDPNKPATTAKLQIEYWDYWRETPPAKIHEFVFVEQNEESGWFQIWRGKSYLA